jgi:Flp pilus assembly protein TadG
MGWGSPVREGWQPGMIRVRMRRGEEGAVAVEFAVILVLLSMILFGIIEFGITLSKYEMYVGAAREGARYAAVRCKPDSSSGCTDALVLTRTFNAMACPQPCTPADVFTPGTPTASKVCSSDPNIVGSEVAVSWIQHFSIRIPFVPDLSFDKEVKGVFRCE